MLFLNLGDSCPNNRKPFWIGYTEMILLKDDLTLGF